MRSLLEDAGHLVRLAAVFLALVALFVIARAALIPKDFGTYGHYRAGALADVRERPIAYAGRAACIDCHGDIDTVKQNGKHAGLACEACHGALAQHAADPQNVVPVEPDPKTLCLVCHRKNVAKPVQFPQVDPTEHAGSDPCGTCHKPHSPLES
jgi:hypothetical protein